jgi:hypothetical protein
MRFDLTTQPMNRAIEKLTLFFVGVFAVCCVGVAVYQVVWVLPEKHCEQRGWWWDPQTRLCGMPVSVTAFTHRPIGSSKVTPSKAQAAPAKPSV